MPGRYVNTFVPAIVNTVQRMRRVRAAFYRKVGFITKSFVLMQVLYFSIHIRIHYFQDQQLPSHDANAKPNAFFPLHTHIVVSSVPQQ